MKRFLAALALLFATPAFAQIAPGPGPVFLAPDLAMRAGQVYVNPKTIPGRKFGSNKKILIVSCTGTATDAATCASQSQAPTVRLNPNDSNNDGAFRTLCNPSHYASDDPIVRPFQSGMTHLHLFFGNTTTDAQRDASKMADFGSSTCAGGILNRTGYWIPPLIYACPTGEVGCTASRNGQVIPAYINSVYYKSQGLTAATIGNVVWPPVGFRMVGGDPNNTDLSRINGHIDCYSTGHGSLTVSPPHIPSSAEVAGYTGTLGGTCDDINVFPFLPDCWNGTDLYLPPVVGGVGSSHVAYRSSGACPSGYSTPLPNISYNVHFRIRNPADWDYLVLSSDHGPEYGNTRTGSTTSQVVLDATASATNDYYKYGYVALSGQRRQITAYVGSTRTATLSSALSAAPASGVSYMVRQAGAITLHGDWANGWNHDANFNGWGRTLTDQFIAACLHDVARYGAFSSTGASGAAFDCHDNNIGAPANTGVPYVSPGPSVPYYQLSL